MKDTDCNRLVSFLVSGYRKAFEFLVKDYSVSEIPDNESEIKSMSLSQCIKKYIDDVRIKTLVERSAYG